MDDLEKILSLYYAAGMFLVDGETPPQMFFNKTILCAGEYVKVRTFAQRRGVTPASIEAELSIFRAEGNDRGEEIYRTSLRSQGDEEEQFSARFQIQDMLKAGPYIARLAYLTANQGGAERGERGDVEETIREHHFYVLEAEEYDNYWRGLFGGEWDDPIYLDTVNPYQADYLLNGLPLEDLWGSLQAPLTLNARNLYYLLGPITTTLIAANMSYTPLLLMTNRTQPLSGPVPSVDLTKLIWHLNALASVISDWAFFGRSLDIKVENDSERLLFHFRRRAENRDGGGPDGGEENFPSQSRLLNIITELADYPYELDFKGDEALLAVRG